MMKRGMDVTKQKPERSRRTRVYVLRFDKRRRRALALLVGLLALFWAGRGELQKLLEGPTPPESESFIAPDAEMEAVPVLAPAVVRVSPAEPSRDAAEPAVGADAIEEPPSVSDGGQEAATPLGGGTGRGHPFDLVIMERERERSREAELWAEIARDGSRSASERDEAVRRLNRLWADSQLETEVEQLLTSQGYKVVVSAALGRLQVVVDEVLDAEAAARIGELIVRSAGVGRDAVTIVDSFSSGG